MDIENKEKADRKLALYLRRRDLGLYLKEKENINSELEIIKNKIDKLEKEISLLEEGVSK